jgi:16S rRNA (adenine1518-N6/adenine1519-N6)-dimethyltransferase
MDIKAKKSLGQNFLINQGILDKIVTAAELKEGDLVLEVGPGTGNLTKKITESGAKVIAVEKDHRLIQELGSIFPEITLVEDDILKFNPKEHNLEAGEYKIVANIPYYLTSHLIRDILENWPKPILVVLMIQKEVAQRITSQAPDNNLLALSSQFYADVEIVASVSPGSFRPMPTVDSSVIKITPKKELPNVDKDLFFRAIKIAFAGKRKMMARTISDGLNLPREKVEGILQELGIDIKIRPEKLSLEQWIEVVQRLN